MATLRVRREPPRFCVLELRRTASVTPRLVRVTVGGAELRAFEPGLPAASVRLLLPRPGQATLTIPQWNGNEFLHADGGRPTIRTYTPRSFDAAALELDLDVVLHDAGAVPAWAVAAQAGDPVGISGPGRGYAIDPEATRFVLAGDESAIPAISQLVENLPAKALVHVLLEITQPDARHELPPHPGAHIDWHIAAPDMPPGSALVAAIHDADIAPDAHLWAAGEAAAMQRIRRHLFEERAMPRSRAVVRGYWKTGRGGDGEV